MSHLKAVILDWAGTVVDHGSLAPLSVFHRAFREVGIELTDDEAKGPMGLPKWYHIKAVGSLPRVAAAWEARHGTAFSDRDVDRLHALFMPMTLEAVAEYAALIPGTLETVADIRARGLKLGSTTGYDRITMDALMPLAAAQGYRPDCVVTASDLPLGRPTPMMMWQCFLELQLWPAAAIVKIDDTPPGIEEGRAAGSWSVGVATSGNLMGLSHDALLALPAEELQTRRQAASDALIAAGAHYVIDSIRDLPAVLDQIEARLAAGESPASYWAV